MTMMGGLKYRYYRCQQNKTKGNAICANATSLREDILRPQLLDTIRDRLLSDDGVTYTRRRAAEELRDASKKLDAELRDRKERLVRTEEKMAGLVDFIANGERVQYIVQTLRDLETFAIQEREAIADLETMASAPLKLPSIPRMVVEDAPTPEKVPPETHPLVSGRYTIVAGATSKRWLIRSSRSVLVVTAHHGTCS